MPSFGLRSIPLIRSEKKIAGLKCCSSKRSDKASRFNQLSFRSGSITSILSTGEIRAREQWVRFEDSCGSAAPLCGKAVPFLGVRETDAMKIAQQFIAGLAMKTNESVQRTTEVRSGSRSSAETSAVRFTDASDRASLPGRRGPCAARHLQGQPLQAPHMLNRVPKMSKLQRAGWKPAPL